MKIVRIPFSRLVTSQGGIEGYLMKALFDMLPSDTKFVGCGTDDMYFIDYIFLTSEQFKDIPEGQKVPDITPYFRRNPDGTAYLEKIDFGDTLPGVCRHCWQTHTGLQETYRYCTICNVKE